MLLEAILKHSQRAGLVEEAVAIEQAFHVMTVVPNQANDMMDIGRLQGFEVHLIKKSLFKLSMLIFFRAKLWLRENCSCEAPYYALTTPPVVLTTR